MASSKTYAPGDSYGFWFTTMSPTTGSLAAADSLPTAVMYKNGTLDAAVTLTVTSMGTGIYRVSGTIPSGYAVGDMVAVLVSAVVGTVTGARVDEFKLDILTNSVAAAVWNSLLATYTTAATFGNKFRQWILGTDFKALLSTDTQPTLSVNTTQLAGQTVTAAAGVTFPASVGSSTFAGGAVASVTAAVTVGTNNDKTGYTLSTLNGLTPNSAFFTNAPSGGTVDLSGIPAAVWTYSAGGGRSLTDKAGYTLDLTQAIPTSNTAQTLGDALNGARAQAFGKWVKDGVTLTLYAANGTTPVRVFTLDDADAPNSRT